MGHASDRTAMVCPHPPGKRHQEITDPPSAIAKTERKPGIRPGTEAEEKIVRHKSPGRNIGSDLTHLGNVPVSGRDSPRFPPAIGHATGTEAI